jgi:hypothetical protein
VAAGYQIGKRADLLAALYQARDDKAARAMYELLAEIVELSKITAELTTYC